ncbi:hypothetical protein BDV98DRAFT_641118 [Pterulicium gracile]|uniref:Uncharacterized protein n=1 Tax=Pterulicium gracile TaxID=1884261 RepID=A0A5C3Q5G5_9AGAR|nr:hypothetical protein BDV98DRAFT_641118 [Pterula gracilis]
MNRLRIAWGNLLPSVNQPEELMAFDNVVDAAEHPKFLLKWIGLHIAQGDVRALGGVPGIFIDGDQPDTELIHIHGRVALNLLSTRQLAGRSSVFAQFLATNNYATLSNICDPDVEESCIGDFITRSTLISSGRKADSSNCSRVISTFALAEEGGSGIKSGRLLWAEASVGANLGANAVVNMEMFYQRLGEHHFRRLPGSGLVHPSWEMFVAEVDELFDDVGRPLKDRPPPRPAKRKKSEPATVETAPTVPAVDGDTGVKHCRRARPTADPKPKKITHKMLDLSDADLMVYKCRLIPAFLILLGCQSTPSVAHAIQATTQFANGEENNSLNIIRNVFGMLASKVYDWRHQFTVHAQSVVHEHFNQMVTVRGPESDSEEQVVRKFPKRSPVRSEAEWLGMDDTFIYFKSQVRGTGRRVPLKFVVSIEEFPELPPIGAVGLAAAAAKRELSFWETGVYSNPSKLPQKEKDAVFFSSGTYSSVTDAHIQVLQQMRRQDTTTHNTLWEDLLSRARQFFAENSSKTKAPLDYPVDPEPLDVAIILPGSDNEGD